MPRSKSQESFADALKSEPAAPTTPPPSPSKVEEETSKRDDVTTSKRESLKGRPHVSLYVNPAVQDAVKRMALDHNFKRPHDVYVEALRRFMASKGEDFDRLQGSG